MKKFNTAPITNVRNVKHFRFSEYILSVITAWIAAILKIDTLRAEYAELFKKKDKAFVMTRILVILRLRLTTTMSSRLLTMNVLT